MKNESETSTEREPTFTRNEAGRLCLRSAEIYDGPWHAEPDRVEFRHAGLPCLLVRGPVGAWCGYVGTPPGHPWRERDLEGVGAPEVHGGVTYQKPCHGDICHVPAPGEPDGVVWVGFDCAHAGDLIFSFVREVRMSGVYRDVAYARRETEQLAEQAERASVSAGAGTVLAQSGLRR
jgi:hypothetical protein